MSKISSKNILILVVGGCIALAGFLFYYTTVSANPSNFLRLQSASATSSISYLTPGTATTTLTFDSGAGASQGADTAVLLEQFVGSSTTAVLNTDIQYSQDGIDWYASGFAGNVETISATSSPSIGIVMQFTFPFASSTINRSVVTNANSATSTRAIRIPMPTRYVRAVFTVPAGSTNGAVWAEFVAKRQNP